ncbi:MAG: esterase-like activity of phytase family protein [Phycisphaerales bacterium]|jgi:hypothetical protein
MRLTLLLAGIAAAASAAQAQTVQNLNYIGQQIFPTATFFGGTQVGGLSGISYDAATNSFFSISDDRSQINPARFYNLSINLADGALNNGDVSFNSVTTLLRPDGTAFPTFALDPEGIAVAPNGDLFVSSEGDTSRGIQPFINRFSRTTGQQVQALPVPSKFLVGNPVSGVRNNLAFETLTLSPNGNSLFTATENALVQDGPAADVTTGTPSRILRYDLNSSQPAQEFVYVTDAVAEPTNPAGAFATNGLVDMLALSDHSFLALERSFSVGAQGAGGTGNIIKLFQVELNGATDVSGLDALGAPGSYTSVTKTLLLNLSDLGIALDNIEGLSFGPTLPNGQRSLILVSDNNFSATQFTQFVAFGVDVVPAPGAVALLGLGGLVATRRRR